MNAFSAADLRRLDAPEVNRSPQALGWLELSFVDRLHDFFRVLSIRNPNQRYRFKPAQLDSLHALLGEDFTLDPKKLFLVAVAIDRAYACFREDHWRAPQLRGQVLPAPIAFLTDVANAPPPIGQMTPMAVGRRWLQNLWYVGRPDAFRSLGDLPSAAPIRLPSRVEIALEAAAEARRLKVGLAQWPPHRDAELTVSRADSTFAVTGYSSLQLTELDDLIERAREQEIDVLILPELSLGDDALGRLREALRTGATRHPTLVVAGLTHAKLDSEAHVYTNQAVLLDSEGNELLRHDKLEPFTHVDLGLENIVPRAVRDYPFIDTPLGRLVLNVCRDVRSDLPMVLNRVIGASLIVVPSYSNRLSFVAEEATLLGARQGAITACVNAANDSLQHRAYVYAPLRGQGSAVTWTVEQTSRTQLLVAEVTVEGGVARLAATPPAR